MCVNQTYRPWFVELIEWQVQLSWLCSVHFATDLKTQLHEQDVCPLPLLEKKRLEFHYQDIDNSFQFYHQE